MAMVAGFFNALWTALSKPVLFRLSSREFTLVFRALTSLFLLPFALAEWDWPLQAAWWGWMILAGLFEGFRIWLLTQGVKRDYFSTYAFYNLSPLFTVLLAPWLLGEPQGVPLILGGVFLAAGAFVFFRLGRWSWPGLFGAILSTGSVIASKQALQYSGPYVLVFWTFAVGAVALSPLEALGGNRIRWKLIRVEMKRILPVAFWSLVATLLFYTALFHAPASKVNPLVRANLLFGFPLSYFLLGEKDDWRSKAWGGLLILMGLALVAVS